MTLVVLWPAPWECLARERALRSGKQGSPRPNRRTCGGPNPQPGANASLPSNRGARYSYEMRGSAATLRRMGGGAVHVAAWSSKFRSEFGGDLRPLAKTLSERYWFVHELLWSHFERVRIVSHRRT